MVERVLSRLLDAVAPAAPITLILSMWMVVGKQGWALCRRVPLLCLSSISGELCANQNSVNHSSLWKMPVMLHF